jgi:radical SAM protein with 4Fe4S-binding SPASM domain
MQINKGQFRLSSSWSRLKFNLKRGRGHLLAYLANRMRWYLYPRLHYAPAFPNHVDIETSSACDMRCPMCYTVTDKFKQLVKPRLMKFELFKKIVDECAANNVFSIRVSLRGEPFLHPQIVEMIRYAKGSGIKEVASLTNGLKLTPERFAELVDIGMDWLTISFDGMGETYERIRKPAKFDEAVEKIRQYRAIKERKGSAKPAIKVQSVWTYIQDDPEAFYDLFAPLVDQVAANPEIDFGVEEDQIEYLDDFTCPTLWQRLVIGADGQVLMCINDEYGRQIIGDLNQQTIGEIWNGEELRQVRQIHLRKAGHRELTPCKTCIYPRKIRRVEARIDGRKLNSYQYTVQPSEEVLSAQ